MRITYAALTAAVVALAGAYEWLDRNHFFDRFLDGPGKLNHAYHANPSEKLAFRYGGTIKIGGYEGYRNRGCQLIIDDEIAVISPLGDHKVGASWRLNNGEIGTLEIHGVRGQIWPVTDADRTYCAVTVSKRLERMQLARAACGALEDLPVRCVSLRTL
jgi:hypothetical protein